MDYLSLLAAIVMVAYGIWLLTTGITPLALGIGLVEIVLGVFLTAITLHHGKRQMAYRFFINPIAQYRAVENAAIAEGYISNGTER